MTAAQYIKSNHLDLKAYELEKLAMNGLPKTPHTYKYSEHDLDDIAAKHHFSCFLPTKRTQEYGFIYILMAYMDSKPLNVCKVGTTIKSPHDRCKTLNKTWFKCGVTFEVHKISKEIPHAVDVEGCIHQVLKAKGLHYVPKCKANGRTELFIYEEWMDNLLPI